MLSDPRDKFGSITRQAFSPKNAQCSTINLVTYSFNTAKLASKSYVFSDACA